MAKVLLAEDDKLASDALVAALGAAGFDAAPAYDGEAALAKFKEWKPDLLILDVAMPKLDGVSVLWELKADPETAKTPVLVLTNLGDVDTVGKIMSAGVADYLVKGENSVEQVLAKVKEILGRTVHLV